ncbi:hypothetical protein THAOC_23463, partial [Thalassiosira oceanica]
EARLFGEGREPPATEAVALQDGQVAVVVVAGARPLCPSPFPPGTGPTQPRQGPHLPSSRARGDVSGPGADCCIRKLSRPPAAEGDSPAGQKFGGCASLRRLTPPPLPLRPRISQYLL